MSFVERFRATDDANDESSQADSGSKPMYFPNSYHKNVPSTKSTPGFAGMDAVEAPYQVANNVVSRKSYWRDECTEREYTQVRELYLNRLSEQERNNLHSNTARLLKFADDIVIEGYLAQVSPIAPLLQIFERSSRAVPSSCSNTPFTLRMLLALTNSCRMTRRPTWTLSRKRPRPLTWSARVPTSSPPTRARALWAWPTKPGHISVTNVEASRIVVKVT